jgi:hypothetical protein
LMVIAACACKATRLAAAIAITSSFFIFPFPYLRVCLLFYRIVWCLFRRIRFSSSADSTKS